MRALISIFLSIIALNSYSQDFSTINFIVKGGYFNVEIQLNGRKIGSLKGRQNLQYKIFSEGQMNIKILTGDLEYNTPVNVKHGKTLYYQIGFHKRFINSEQGIKEFANNDSTILGKEDLSNLIIKPSSDLLDDEDDLPHSIIYLVRSNKAWYSNGVYITFPNQQRIGILAGSAVIYKIYSEGEITVELDYSGGMGRIANCNLNVKRGNEYYLYINKDELKEVTKPEVADILTNPKNLSRREETLDFPISRNSIKDLAKKDGKGQGTCFLISANGYLVTNAHCVENAKEINIMGIEGDFTTKYLAKIVGIDPSNDLALLKLSNNKLNFESPPFGIRSTGVAQAEKVYALGYPSAIAMGEEIKITERIISSKSGAQNDISKFQISAGVNHGNSGGPLIDEEGNLIGVIYAKSTVAESAGYAIKASYLETFLKNIDGFEYPVYLNTLKNESLTSKVAKLKGYIFILETK